MIRKHMYIRIMANTRLFVCLLLILYVSGCASLNRRSKNIQSVIKTARSYTGTPYKWGGTEKSGMDCSGLLVNSFQSIKVDIPRTSKEQSKTGERITLREAQPGDLVFFATGKKKRKVTHVGMVTEVLNKGSIKFIHASTSIGVTESELYSDYYIKRFRMVRRII